MYAPRRGIVNLVTLFVALSAVIIFLFLTRQNIYSFFQNFTYKIGINLNNIAKDNYVEWINNLADEFEYSQNATYLNKRVNFTDQIAKSNQQILGESSSSNGEKWIEVDLSDQRLYMKEGETTVGNFLVSTGKWSPTPTGEWRIWTKLRYTRMKGGSKALGTYYNLPNVPYTMYYHQGYGLHGAYWHNNFGHPMSHGCVNMRPEEAGVVFNWASVGTRVVVHQ